MQLPDVLAQLRLNRDFISQAMLWEKFLAQPARFQPVGAESDERIMTALRSRGVEQFFTHQAEAITAVSKVEQAAQVLFGGDLDGLDATDIADIFADVPSSELPKAELAGDGYPAVTLLADSGLVQSKGDAKRTIKGGGIYLNNQRIEDPGQMVTTNDLLEGKFLVLRNGRKKYHLVKILS